MAKARFTKRVKAGLPELRALLAVALEMPSEHAGWECRCSFCREGGDGHCLCDSEATTCENCHAYMAACAAFNWLDQHVFSRCN